MMRRIYHGHIYFLFWVDWFRFISHVMTCHLHQLYQRDRYDANAYKKKQEHARNECNLGLLASVLLCAGQSDNTLFVASDLVCTDEHFGSFHWWTRHQWMIYHKSIINISNQYQSFITNITLTIHDDEDGDGWWMNDAGKQNKLGKKTWNCSETLQHWLCVIDVKKTHTHTQT